MVSRWCHPSLHRPGWAAALVLAVWALAPGAAEARQLGALVSPGRLSQPHASLEGIRSCDRCHEAGQRVTAAKCLTCHQPVADRIRARRGVHRDVQGDCVTCHAEHQGTAGELRPFDTATFDHTRDAVYPLDGRHAPLAANCASCHKTRSFLAATTACASCHIDAHKGTLGAKCETCHTTRTAFKDVRQGFDHTKAAFQLDGAHRRVACESCHKNQVFKGLAFTRCSDCHTDPHTPKMAESCASCHTSASWRARRFDHARTKFPLLGRHQTTACAECHVRPALQVTPRFDTCAACHQDPHRGSFKQACSACHNEQSFAKAPFDHTTTPFPLTGKHAPATCVACHKNLTRVAARTGRAAPAPAIDFRGLKRDCLSCHDDTHKGDLGTSCEACHGTERFALPTYAHRTPSAFFEGSHAIATCVTCHALSGPAAMPALVRARTSAAPATLPSVPAAAGASPHGPLATAKFTASTQVCASCHADVHLGQVGAACETCHGVALAKFAVSPGFDHARTKFRLGGKHAPVACEKCHKPTTGAFPSGTGTAVKLTGIGSACLTCHTDVHLGQLGATCETCHSDQTFKIANFTHRNPALRGFFVGAHERAACDTCHDKATGTFPAGKGTAVRYAVSTECTSCHRDVHNGALGTRCADCHKPDMMAGLPDGPSLHAAGGNAR